MEREIYIHTFTPMPNAQIKDTWIKNPTHRQIAADTRSLHIFHVSTCIILYSYMAHQEKQQGFAKSLILAWF
jgi:hypothetical protein